MVKGRIITLYRPRTSVKQTQTKPIKWLVDEETGCWNCISHSKHRGGYVGINETKDGVGRRVSLHRWMYKKYNGEIPEGLVVRHKCDNPQCSNPNHLELGTVAENNQDMVLRGRTTKGKKKNFSQYRALLKYNLEGELVKEYESVSDARKDGFPSETMLRQCCLGKRKAYKGYVFRYKEPK